MCILWYYNESAYYNPFPFPPLIFCVKRFLIMHPGPFECTVLSVT